MRHEMLNTNGFRRGGALACVLLAALAGCKQPDGATSQNGGAAGGTAAGGGTSTGGAATADIGKAAPYKGDNILLGEYGALTGSTASFGNSTHNGIQMAIDEANKAGGVLGKQIALQSEDDAGKPEEAATAVKKLINSNNVLAILGEVASSRSLAAAPICQKAGVPMLTPSSTNPEVTKVGDYIFRTCFIDPFQGRVLAEFARNNLKAQTVAVLTDSKQDYSTALSKFFQKEYKNLGGKVVAEEFYVTDDKDFRAQLTNIKGKNPDVIFIPGYYTDAGNIAIQVRSLGMNQPLLGGDGWDSPALMQIGKKAVQGTYFSTHYSADSPDPKVVKFVTAYRKAFKATPDSNGAVAYDAARLMIDAIKRAGSTDRAKIRDALASTKNFAGVTGNITIGPDRNAVKPIVVLQVKGDKLAVAAAIKAG